MSILRVGDHWRTNPLSLKPGGHDVTVIWQSGETRVYDKVKSPKGYVASISKKPTKHGLIMEVWVDGKLEWKRDDSASTSQAWLDFLAK
jgi:hypothetical protein